MTIADKLIRAKTDYDEVYEAGKQEIISLHPEKTASGSYISVDDVSELPHSVACKVESVANPESVTVTRCGRNLLNPNNLGGGELVEFNGVPCYKYIDKGEDFPTTLRIEGCFKENTQYTFTIKQYREETNTNQKWLIHIRYTDGTEEPTAYVPTKTMYTFTTAAGKTVAFIYSPWYSGSTAYLDLSVSCLYESAVELPYEPYNGQTLTPSADGIIEGMTSVSPYMYIFSDTEGVNLEATYRQSKGIQTEWDRFWDNHPTASGSLVDGTNLFSGAGWNDITFRPKNNIKPNSSYMLFKGCHITELVKILKECNVVLDLSETYSLYYAFNDTKMTHIGDVYLIHNNFVTQEYATQAAFAYSSQLHTIDKIIVNNEGTTLISSDAFSGCNSLANITFEGVIGNSINFQWCPLTKTSITNIIEHLSGTATGQTLTLKKTAKEAAFTADEWAALIANKTNWTFSLV